MTEYIGLGSTPYDEPCAEVGADGYSHLSRMECATYKAQLARKWRGKIPDGASFTLRRFDHDFGPYLEVVVAYAVDSIPAVEFALAVEANTPARWDAAARRTLASGGYTLHLKEA